MDSIMLRKNRINRYSVFSMFYFPTTSLISFLWVVATLSILSTNGYASVLKTCDASNETSTTSTNGEHVPPTSPFIHRRHDDQTILIGWLNDHPHGFFNPKQQIQEKQQLRRRRDDQRRDDVEVDDDDTILDAVHRYPSYSSNGVFAKEDIAVGEVLLQVPWELVIGYDPMDGNEMHISDEGINEENVRRIRSRPSIHCDTVRNLARLLSFQYQEKTVQQDQKDRPNGAETTTVLSTYLNYLLDTYDDYSLPVSWSDAGKHLFLQVLGGAGYRSLLMDDAFSLFDYEWDVVCGGGGARYRSGDGASSSLGRIEGLDGLTMEEISTMLIRQRAVSHAFDSDDEPTATWMVPLYDLYAHRNGPTFLNTRVTISRMSSFASTDPHISNQSSQTVDDGTKGDSNTPTKLFQLVALHDIPAGEEIHISYTKQALAFCEPLLFLCARESGDDIDDDHDDAPEASDYFDQEYGTPEFFTDHGFIEDFPQRWVLPQGELLLEKDFGDGVLHTFVFPRPSFTIEVDDKPYRNHGTVIDENFTSATTTSPIDWEGYSLSWKIHVDTVLNGELRRLLRLTNVLWEKEKLKAIVPQNELDRIIAFHQSFADALKSGINGMQKAIAAEQEVTVMNKIIKTGHNQPTETNDKYESTSAYVLDHYVDFFRPDVDNLGYNEQNCRSSELHDFLDYETFIEEKSNYQEMHFQNRQSDSDLCLHLDDMLQICTSYRPHYHEFFIHYPAQFVESIKRVVFLGSGDSMLLHEILKYPTLEKVVGLELDQHVTRKSFEHFKTQPHFDDSRVEWWFGDATKTLPVLPKEYWGSFDLVLVDLSETVVSMSVTGEHDVLDVISMLLQPKGILLENELYLDKMSRHFDHVIQIFYGSPKVCTQVLTLASNGVDFLHSPMYDHGVESYLVDFPKKKSDRFFFIHDYMRVALKEQQLCIKTESISSTNGERKPRTEQGRKAGILEIVEAENCGTRTVNDGVVEERIHNVLVQFDMTPVKVAVTTTGGISSDDIMIGPTIVIMEEGYIVARCWDARQYCALDVQLWGAYHKRPGLVSALTEELQSTVVSSYRIVTGGMYGTKTWEDDQQQIGVQFTNNQNCRDPYTTSNEESSPTVVDLWDDSLKTLVDMISTKESRKLVVAVACGAKINGNDCRSVEWMTKHPLVSHVETIYMCPTVDSNAAITVEALVSMHNCERGIISQLRQMSSMEGGKMSIDILVLDDTVEESMGRILDSILSEQSHRQAYLSDNYLMVVPTLDSNETTTWRNRYLDRYRRLVQNSAILSLAEFQWETSPSLPSIPIGAMDHEDETKGMKNVKADDGILILGMIYCCDEHAIAVFTEFEQSLRDHHEHNSSGTILNIVSIFGGELQPPRDIVAYEQRTFPMDAYNLTDHNKQMTTQEALGRQTIVQLEPTIVEDIEGRIDKESTTMVRFDDLYRYLEATVVTTMGYGPIWTTEKYHGLDQLGALGGAISIIYPQGNVVLVWDGQHHVDINIFSYNQNKELHDRFIDAFCSWMKFFEVKLRDDQPRGVGRVVSFGLSAS